MAKSSASSSVHPQTLRRYLLHPFPQGKNQQNGRPAERSRRELVQIMDLLRAGEGKMELLLGADHSAGPHQRIMRLAGPKIHFLDLSHSLTLGDHRLALRRLERRQDVGQIPRANLLDQGRLLARALLTLDRVAARQKVIPFKPIP